jgi:hypothetical protein
MSLPNVIPALVRFQLQWYFNSFQCLRNFLDLGRLVGGLVSIFQLGHIVVLRCDISFRILNNVGLR